MRAAGHRIDVVTVGSTPTARHASRVNGVTELRACVYAFLDIQQVSLGVWTIDRCALTVLATVVSHARPEECVLDAGRRTFAGENYEWGTYGRNQQAFAVDDERIVGHCQMIGRGRVL